MEVLEKPSTHFLLPHSPKTEPRIWGVRNEEARVAQLETARLWYGAMLTTCPNCLHVLDQPLSSSCCASRPPLAPSQGSASPPPPVAPSALAPSSSSSLAAASLQPEPSTSQGLAAVAAPAPLMLSATLQLPPSAIPTTCTLALTTSVAPPLRALAGMAGGGIVLQQHTTQDLSKSTSLSPMLAPQPSPSAPLSFVLPTLPTVATPRTMGPMGPMGALPFQWAMPSQAWAGASVHVNVQMPAAAVTPTLPASTPTLPQVPQSDMDLERLAATMSSLRASGWYYEGLSWQESADLLQATAPGTFFVRDSSDPRFLFSLSVQTEREPTSIRLHYVCGNFRLDAEPKLAPFLPLFDCVVKLVEYYVESTSRRENKSRGKEQVWVDARGHMFSHILLRTPLYKKQQLPSLQHLTRLAINKQLRAAGKSATTDVHRLPLPTPLQSYIKEYPYMS